MVSKTVAESPTQESNMKRAPHMEHVEAKKIIDEFPADNAFDMAFERDLRIKLREKFAPCVISVEEHKIVVIRLDYSDQIVVLV